MMHAISVENISKEYLLGSELTGSQNFREMLGGALTAPFRKFKRLSGQDSEQERFWALEDISFDVFPGEILGVIGLNGAGKSTLLKVLSRITSPTKGRIQYRGRLASLLEVGTGFHPELTGRENIYLNGAILGMSREEVSRKLDAIVDFAGVEKFLDTPVKRFSSGMYVRLAFSVAAHLDPDILVIDEVLAVGDFSFQKKCLGKMKDVAGDGRTIIFVSHNISTIKSLCTKSLYLKNGTIEDYGDVREVISSYVGISSGSKVFVGDDNKRKEVSITRAKIKSVDANSITLELVLNAVNSMSVGIDYRISEKNGQSVGIISCPGNLNTGLIDLSDGKNEFEYLIDTSSLIGGEYSISIDISIPGSGYLDREDNCLSFELEEKWTDSQTRPVYQRWGYGSANMFAKLIV